VEISYKLHYFCTELDAFHRKRNPTLQIVGKKIAEGNDILLSLLGKRQFFFYFD
jgi:hypothetical protein